jgi:hypothetical protein
MTTTEFKEQVAASQNSDSYNKLKESIVFPQISFLESFTGVTSLYEFINQQCEGWNNLGDKIPGDLVLSRAYFAAYRDRLIQFVTNTLNFGTDQVNSQWRNTTNQFNSLFANNLRKILLFDSPETKFLLTVAAENVQYFQGAYECIIASINLGFEK